MPLILLVEPEGRWVERVRDALSSDGIRVKAVNEREAALRSVAEEAPDLVLVNYASSGASELLATLGRTHGGPGVVALVPERLGAIATGADEDLRKPFTDQEVRLLVKRQLGAARAGRRTPVAPAPEGEALSSRELFADLLEEVEREASGGSPAALPLPLPVVAKPSAPAAPRPGTTVEAKLEQTLSGLFDKPERSREPRPAAPPADRRDDVDRLLSATLSGLNLQAKPRPASVAVPPQPVATPSPKVPAPVVPAAAAPSAPPRSAPSAPPAITAPVPVHKVRPPAPVEAPKPAPTPAPPVAPKAPAKSDPGAEKPTLAADFATQRVPILRPAPPPPPKAETGREFGPYTLLERVAVGGMAEVWKARRAGVEGFQKLVAIKKILPHLNDSPDFVAMLIDEAKLAAQLTHPNVTQIYDLGKIGDDHYIAMEFVDGRDMRAVLNALRPRGETLPRGLALLVASRLAGALDYAHHKRDFDGHELGLVHRDVSPQNVLISHDGIIKLCDFGIVKAVSRTHQTQMGALKGKLQYMSPEQAWGRRVDGRSDIFSLGSLLFEMLTGKRVFAGDTEISILESVREGRVPRLGDVAPDTPAAIQALVGRALERDPADRFASAGEMQRELDRLVAEERPVPTEAEMAALLRRIFGAAPSESVSASAPVATASGAGSATGARAATPTAAPESASEVSVPVVMPAPGARPASARKSMGPWVGLGAAAAAVLIVAGVLWTRETAPPAPPAVGAAPVEGIAATGSEAIPAETSAAASTAAPSDPSLGAPGTSAAVPAPDSTAPQDAGNAGGLAQLVDQEFAKREQALRQQYEAEKKRLEEQLRQARAGQTGPAPASAPATASAPPSASPAVEPVASPPAAPADEVPASAASTAPAEAVAEQEPEAVAPEVPPAVLPPPAPEPTPRIAPTVESGALVTMGPGVVAPQLISRLEPRYPALARSRNATASVTIEVLVDERGLVTQARLLKGDDRGLGFNEAALNAAQVARFRPATKNGVPVKMWKALVFPFQL